MLLLKPRGFCAGVVRAIDVVRIALETFGAPIYVRREIVHNRYVVNYLRQNGFENVEEVEVMPENVRFGLPPEIVQTIAAAPTQTAAAVQ